MSENRKAFREKVGRFKYVLIVAAVGLVLLLWPSGGMSVTSGESLEATEEARLESLLTNITGVGQVQLLLSEEGAVVVCEGADSVSVCLCITQAVRCYTGLGADKVEIFKMK